MAALLVAALLLGVSTGAATAPQAQAKGGGDRRLTTKPPGEGGLVKRIEHYREKAWHFQRVMGKRRALTSHSYRRHADRAYRRWVLRLWRRRADVAFRRFRRPPHERHWRCIHRYEGPWTDRGAPYYGGLQMDIGFQQTYGRYLLKTKGTADRWTPLEQMWVAERALKAGRGFYPWPDAARICGLI
jgi:hypothetical protein